MGEITRRQFAWQAGAAGLLLPVTGLAEQAVKGSAKAGGGKKEGGENEEEVTPAEDLMREHGLLNRILLIYEECGRRIAEKRDFDRTALNASAGIIHHFIEDYHEKLEEDYLFPRFEKAGKLVDLVKTLRAQHQAGRTVTLKIEALTRAGVKPDPGQLQAALQAFLRMYRPHEAREDTVLFPAIHEIVSRNEYDALGEDFERREHQLFGKEGFEGMVPKVAELEKSLGIYELAQFTPGG
jgi:hemerythrin-like domain-containing protein